MAEETYSTQRLDHLGIAAGICQRISLVEQIDTYVGVTGRKVSFGEAVQAMVLNAPGFVGQWNASNETDDRREMRMDIGLLVSQDAVHYREPIPDFRIIDTTEEGWKGPNPLGAPPRFAQGQGIVNIGDKTITWYSIW